jgi:hypothetical protein
MTIVRVFVNARGYDVPADATALDALRVADAAEAEAVVAGSRLITDSRGLPVPPETTVYGGVIYRVIANRARNAGADA